MIPTFATVLGLSDFAIIAWLLIVFGGSAAYASRKSVEMHRIERKLDALLKYHGVTLPPHAKLSEQVERLARDPAQRSNSVLLHRTETGIGLEEATSDVDAFIRSIR